MAETHELPDGRLRVSARQRDIAAGILREALVDGRLEPEELESRLPSALNAFTRADLYRILDDLVPAADLPNVVGDTGPVGDGPGMSWENPLLIRTNWKGHEELGSWDLPPFVEVLGTGYSSVTLNCVNARALANVIDVVITGNASVTVIVPEGWGVDLQQLNLHGSGGTITSEVPTRPTKGKPRLILRGSTSYSVRIREPNRWDKRRMRRYYERLAKNGERSAITS